MAFSERSGRKVSEYRKQALNHTQGMSMPATGTQSDAFVPLAGEQNRVTQLKHLRGFVTLAPQFTTYTKYAHGYVCLIRYPQQESIGSGDIIVGASYLLHPVPFAVIGYPQTIPYEYAAVTLGPQEKLVMVIHAYGNQNLFLDASFIWDERKQITD